MERFDDITVRFELQLEGVRSRQHTPLGTLVLEEKLSASESTGLKFRPWQNATWDLRPVGFINKSIRKPAYRGSERTR